MMLTTPSEAGGREGNGGDSDSSNDDVDDASIDEDDDEAVEAAVEILDSVRIGSGARITDLTVWSYGGDNDIDDDDLVDDDANDCTASDDSEDDESIPTSKVTTSTTSKDDKLPAAKKRKGENDQNAFTGGARNKNDIGLDDEAVKKARKLVGQAKKHQKRKQKKKD